MRKNKKTGSQSTQPYRAARKLCCFAASQPPRSRREPIQDWPIMILTQRFWRLGLRVLFPGVRALKLRGDGAACHLHISVMT